MEAPKKGVLARAADGRTGSSARVPTACFRIADVGPQVYLTSRLRVLVVVFVGRTNHEDGKIPSRLPVVYFPVMRTDWTRALRKSLKPTVWAAVAVAAFSLARAGPSQDKPAGAGQRSERSSENTAAAFVAEQLRKGKKPNRLVHEKSPYLLQHAFNPVDWHPWGEEAFARARKENKLIF